MDKVFEADEQVLGQVDPTWDIETLLSQEGTFFLKDLVEPLHLRPYQLKMLSRTYASMGDDAPKKMGLRKVWNHYLARMSVFAPYYREHMQLEYRSIDPAWDGNTLLAQKGIFTLAQVCTKIPFSANQIRYQARRNQQSAEEMGVWKTADGTYLVDMARFSVWLKALLAYLDANPIRSQPEKQAQPKKAQKPEAEATKKDKGRKTTKNKPV